MALARGIAPGEYYHLMNRGAGRMGVFKDRSDYMRMLFGVLHFQSPAQFPNMHRIIAKGSPTEGFPLPLEKQEEVINTRLVELAAFCIMGNHFHLLVKEVEEGGVAKYMQRVLTAYTMYFNAKYKTSGHLFQGRYKAVHVADDRQLTYLSAYIHKNPHDMAEWRGKEFEYPWSSLQDYTLANRWGGLIVPDVIVGQFERTKGSNYADFVRTSTAKVFAEELGVLNLSEAS